MSPRLRPNLEIDKCPHCNVDKPNLVTVTSFETRTHTGGRRGFWNIYSCNRCGGAVLAGSDEENGFIREVYPSGTQQVDDSIPEPARNYLIQALDSVNAPAGSVMLSASAVDAMLKLKEYKEGSLYTRIDQAKTNHLITEEMARWAHEVRLDANEPRHADEIAPLPTNDDARKCIDFVLALGLFLFVLPTRVQRGLAEASTVTEEPPVGE